MFRLIFFLQFSLLVLVSPVLRAGIVAVTANGLTDKFITTVNRDNQGLMWIGTHQGLYTYDGYEYIALNAAPLHSTNITHLVYDKSCDLLWVATESGVYSIRARARKMVTASNAAWSRQPVARLISNHKGGIYVSFRNGVVAFGTREQSLKIIARIQEPLYEAGNLVTEPATGVTRLVVRSEISNHTLLLNNDTIVTRISRQVLHKVIGIGSRYIVAADGGSVQLYDAVTLKDVTPKDIRQIKDVYNVTDVTFRDDSLLYVMCRPSLLYRINIVNGTYRVIEASAFTGRLSTSIFFDENGLVWIGTNKGLLKMSPDENIFRQQLVANPTISVRPMVRDESGDLYAGTYSGLYKSTGRNNELHKIADYVPYTSVNLPGNYIYFAGEATRRDHNRERTQQNAGGISATTPREQEPEVHLHRMDKRTGKLENDFYTAIPENEDNMGQVYCLYPDDDGLLWLGCVGGLRCYDPAKRQLTFSNKINWPYTNIAIRSIRPASNGRLWFGTSNGVYLVDKIQGVVWHANTQTKPALSFNIINYVDETADGSVWICTVGGGVNIISEDRNKVRVLKTEQGLSDNVTYQLLWDKNGRAWISTYNGLSSYHPAKGTFRNYYVSDGLSSNECNHNSFLKDVDGPLHFGTISGFNSFHPDSIDMETKPYYLFASNITKWDNNTRTITTITDVDTSNTITLTPLDHSLSFTLAMTDYAHPENNTYQYRIIGLFNEWTNMTDQHIIRLDGLAPGNFTLEIKGRDSRGVPAANKLHYKIIVQQAFYKAWWFYLLLFVLVSSLVWSFFFLRLKHVRRVQKLKEQIASDLHDEVGSLLTRITMTSDNLRYNQGIDQPVASGLQKIASLSRTAISSMSDVLWTIDTRNDYTGNLADRMQEHADEMLGAIDAGFHFDINVSQKRPLTSTFRQQLYFIFKEAINNIVKHSHPTSIIIKYQHNEAGFELLIENNGLNEKMSSSRGQGMKNIAMRAKRIGAHAEITVTHGVYHVRIYGK